MGAPQSFSAEHVPVVEQMRLYELLGPLGTATAADVRAAHLYGEALEAMQQRDHLAAVGLLKEVVEAWPHDCVAIATLRLVTDSLSGNQARALKVKYSRIASQKMLKGTEPSTPGTLPPVRSERRA